MMRTLLLLLSLHAACDRPDGETETEATAGETNEGEDTEEPRTARARGTAEESAEPVPPPALEGWATIVGTYVTEDGGFRYEGLKANEAHLALLADTVTAIGEAGDDEWERDEALAFYVNAYNALTVKAVLDHWPTESVMRVEGFFDTLTHQVAGSEMTLNSLENDILRDKERFGEPRIHFIVNCASKSCPPLASELYTAENIEAKMALATRTYVRGTTQIADGTARVSRLFEWFAIDFGGDDGVRAFISGQLEGDAAEKVQNPRTTIGFHDYDWALNGRPEPETDGDDD